MNRDLSNVTGYIYKLTSPNGKIYIGQTINNRRRKYYYNSGCFKQQTKLYHSVNFYSWNPCETYEVIDECLCGTEKETLNEREMYWINYYDSFKNGLNCNEGGHGNVGYKHTKESRKKMSIAKIGVKHPQSRNDKKSEYMRGRKHTDYTKDKISKTKLENMSDETRHRISAGLMGNKNGLGNKGPSKKIWCINNDIIYDSIKEAASELNLYSSNIIQVCKGKYKQTGGFVFEYYIE